jgi:hypothetical protein
MIKELFLAVILGALLGFGITGGVVAIRNNKTAASPTIVSPTPAVSGTVSTTPQSPDSANNLNTSSHQITIDSPENNSVVTNAQLTLKGSTSPQSHLVITTPSKTYFTTADNAGNFNADIEIDSGVNQIQVDSIDASDNQATIQIIITYSTAKF